MRFILLTLIVLSSCTNSRSIKRRNLDHLYIGGAQEKYFLADLPTWANFSSISQCRISTSVKYLNFSNLYRSYGLSYEKLIQFQYMFNKNISDFKKEANKSEVILQDEAFIFFNTQEKILGGAKQFLKPNYSQVNVFWIDPAIEDAALREKLISKLKSKDGQDGYPVFLSRCLDHVSVEEFIKKNKLDNLGIRYLPSSMFTPYSSFMTLGYRFELDLNLILKDREITFFGPMVPDFVKGKMKVKNY